MALNFRGPDRVPVVFRVNGERVQVLIEPRRTLLSVLQEELELKRLQLMRDQMANGVAI